MLEWQSSRLCCALLGLGRAGGAGGSQDRGITWTDTMDNPKNPGASCWNGDVPSRWARATKGKSGGDDPRFPEIQGTLCWPGPSQRITAENSQLQEKGWECLAHLLTSMLEHLGCRGRSGMRNWPRERIHGALRTPTPSWGWAAQGGGGGGESSSFQNLPRCCHQPKEDQGCSRGDAAFGIGCGAIHVDMGHLWSSSWEGPAASQAWQGSGSAFL